MERIYLAGPIAGCNERQKREWREAAKAKLGKGFEFIDPVLTMQGTDESPASVVERDRNAIETCDAVLANMWKESIGTAIGIFHAWSKAKVTVVVDPNHIGSPTVQYYADDVTDTLGEALKSLRHILRAESKLSVLKRSGAVEPFSRRKLAKSVRRACWEAGADDVVLPAHIRRRAVEAILDHGAEMHGEIRTRVIEDAVFGALEKMDSPQSDDVLATWRGYLSQRRAEGVADGGSDQVRIYDEPQRLAVASHKSHSSIWDVNVKSVGDVPGAARDALRAILRVEGVKQIRLTKFGAGQKPASVQVQLVDSMTPGIVEGHIYDASGVKGTVQHFQVVLAQPEREMAIRAALDRVLRPWSGDRGAATT